MRAVCQSFAIVGFVALLAGCNDRAPGPMPLSHNLGGDGQVLMPTGRPKINAMYLSDPATVKPPPAAELTDDQFAELTGISKDQLPGGASEGGESAQGEGGEVSALIKSLAGGGEGGEGGGAAVAAPTSDEVVAGLRDEARPAVEEPPPNPGGRGKQGIQIALAAAVKDAHRNLLIAALQLPLDSENPTIMSRVEKEEVSSDFKFADGRIVAMNWTDADTLEVEVEMSVEDIVMKLAVGFSDVDFSAVKKVGESKLMAAKGKGVIPPNLRNADRNVPGRMAEEAAGGLGI